MTHSEQAGPATTDAELEAVTRQKVAMAALRALPKGSSVEAMRMVTLECQLADIEVALIRIPRGPKFARRVGAVRKQRLTIIAIIEELRCLMAAKKSRETSVMEATPQRPAEQRQAQSMKIMSEAKKQLAQIGLEVSLIARSPNGARWPVLMLEAGETLQDIEAARQGNT